MNKATEIKIEATAKTIVEMVNACFSDTSAKAKVKAILVSFATEVEANAIQGLEQPPQPPQPPPPIPAHD